MSELPCASIRRLRVVLVVCVLVQLSVPPPALAWFGWLDKWSGPGQWIGALTDIRLMCFGDKVLPDGLPTQQRVMKETLTRVLDNIDNASVETRPRSHRQAILTSAKTDLEFLVASFRTTEQLVDVFKNSPLRQQQLRVLGFAVKEKSHTSDDRLLQELKDTLATTRATMDSTIATLTSAIAALAEPARDVVKTPAQQGARVDFAQLKTDVRSALAPLIGLAGTIVRPADIQVGSGAFVALCPDEESRERAIAVDWRNWFNVQTSPRFADGQPFYFTTGSLAFSVRGTNSDTLDIVDVGAAVGLYGLFAKGVRPSSGIVLEPLRVDFHLPPMVSRRGPLGNFASRLTARYSFMIFPGGISAKELSSSEKVRGGEIHHSFALFLKLLH